MDLTADVESGPGAGERLRRAVMAPIELIGSVLLPDRRLPSRVAAGRYVGAMIVVVLMMLFGAWAIGLRYDPSLGGPGGPGGPGGRGGPPAAQQQQRGPQNGEDRALPSDREVAENMAKQKRVKAVMLNLGAGLGTPLWIFLGAVGWWIAGRFVGGRPSIRRMLAAVAHIWIPTGVKAVIAGAAALSSTRIGEQDIPNMVSSLNLGTYLGPGPAAMILGHVDVFYLWTFLLSCIGFSEAAQVSRLKGFLTVTFLFVLGILLRMVMP
jgi:hypothetical protein